MPFPAERTSNGLRHSWNMSQAVFKPTRFILSQANNRSCYTQKPPNAVPQETPPVPTSLTNLKSFSPVPSTSFVPTHSHMHTTDSLVPPQPPGRPHFHRHRPRPLPLLPRARAHAPQARSADCPAQRPQHDPPSRHWGLVTVMRPCFSKAIHRPGATCCDSLVRAA
jgi:hypothetical protein